MIGLVLLLTVVSACLVHGQFVPPGRPPTRFDGCNGQFHCDLDCTHGFLTDQDGCRVCQCAYQTSGGDVKSHAGNPVSQTENLSHSKSGSHVLGGSSASYTNPCFPELDSCSLQCAYGYETGKNGCQFCFCAPKPVLPSDGFYSNPCPDAAPECDANCPGGSYVTGASGCQYCTCKMTDQTTTGPVSDSTTTPSPYADGDCAVKLTECTLTCPFGFMTSKSDCNMCICKDDIYNAASIPVERQPKVRLSNPCIQGFDVCMIICRSGYLEGPRSCQFCACRE